MTEILLHNSRHKLSQPGHVQNGILLGFPLFLLKKIQEINYRGNLPSAWFDNSEPLINEASGSQQYQKYRKLEIRTNPDPGDRRFQA